jgi:alkylhydroperoxidase family enzyme
LRTYLAILESTNVAKKGDFMAAVNPLTKEKAPPAARETFDALTKKFGKMPNIFALMAHRPDVLNKFLPLYGAIITEGTVDQRYKELAYLKTSMINGCEY